MTIDQLAEEEGVSWSVTLYEFGLWNDARRQKEGFATFQDALNAWVAEKQSVTFVLIPSADTIFTAFRPAGINGILKRWTAQERAAARPEERRLWRSTPRIRRT